MYDFPVNVSQTEDGSYEARLADLDDSPVGRGNDPYAALEDLSAPVKKLLAEKYAAGALPTPSDADDRPTLTFDPEARESGEPYETAQMFDGSALQFQMLGYSWTNTSVV